MTYYGPSESDYTNVYALNREYLRLVRATPGFSGLDEPQQARLTRLGSQQIERLAKTPFLLFSLQEEDGALWQSLLASDRNQDLFQQVSSAPAGINNLLTAAVGLLWQLARNNGYAVRLLSGAGPDWCEMVSGMTYFDLVSRVAGRSELLTARQTATTDIWAKLLDAGVRPERPVRVAAHISVLQTLLTSDPDVSATAWQLAACKSKSPHLKVAEGPPER